jgi:hypothetical protein
LSADDFGVVDEPIDHRGGDERFVRGDDDAGAFVAGADELEEKVRGFGFEGDVADFVDDVERVAAEAPELVVEPAGVVREGEPVDPLRRGREEDPMSCLAGPVHWHNAQRLHGYTADLPPAEFEAAFYAAQQADQTLVGIQ